MGLIDRLLGRAAAEPAAVEVAPPTATPRFLPVGFDADLIGLYAGWPNSRLGEKVGTAARCLQLVAQQLAAMPLRFRGNYQPMWVANPDPAWFPNGIEDALFAAFTNLYGVGDAFLLVTDRYDTGYARAWTVLDSRQVTVESDGRTGRRYRVKDVQLDPDDVLQITRNPTGALRGTSALEGYASNVVGAFAAEKFSADFFTGGGVPWAVLQPARRLSEEQARELQGQWSARAGVRGGAPAVIPPDVKFEQFAYSPRDLLLLESREWDAKQIAAAYGVPAFMLNMDQGGGLNYSNPTMLFDTWWRTELYPTGRRFEQALSSWLPRGSWVEFDPGAILRPDLKAMVDAWTELLDHGAVTVDELRAAVLDLPPLSEGEALELLDEPPGSHQPGDADPPPLAAVPESGVA